MWLPETFTAHHARPPAATWRWYCRYDCVEELVGEEEVAFNVAACLKKLPKDLDRWGPQVLAGGSNALQYRPSALSFGTPLLTRTSLPAACVRDGCRMCGSLVLRPGRSESAIQRRIGAMILLHEALAVLPALAGALQGARCELLQVRRCCLPLDAGPQIALGTPPAP